MSVTFSIANDTNDDRFVNVSCQNAADLLRHIRLPVGDGATVEYGAWPAKDFAVLCRRALFTVAGKVDPAIEPTESVGAKGCRVIECGRREGYLEMRTRELLALAEAAPDGENIVWG